MEQPNVNQMSETQKRLYKKIQERKALEAQKAKAEAEQAATQQAKKKKRNRNKKKKNAANKSENGESSVTTAVASTSVASEPSSPAANSENADPSPQQQQSSSSSSAACAVASKKNKRRRKKTTTAVKKETVTESSESTSTGEPSATDEKQESEVVENTKPKSEKPEIERQTFSEVQQRLQELEDQALGRRPKKQVKGAENAPDWLGKEGNEKVMAGTKGNATHHVVTGDDDEFTPMEKAKMQALLGNAKAANTKSYVGLKNVTQTLTQADYDSKMTVVFQSCRGCHFTMDALCTKVFITACNDFTLTIDKKIVTQTMELFRCSNVTTNINVKVRTVQADMSDKVTLKFNTKENFDNIIWAGCDELVTEFGDVPDRMATGWEEVQEDFVDLHKERTQFKIHYVAGKLTLDKIIRMSDGFPTTKRDYDEYMRKQEAAIQAMAKNMGITINKKVKPKAERVGRNDPCPCGNGKKFKNCKGCEYK